MLLSRLGHAYRLQGRFREARESFLKVLAIDPAARSAYYDAGVASRLLRDERAARRYFNSFRALVEKRIAEDGRNAELQLELAAVLARQGDAVRAAATAARAAMLDPSRHFEQALVSSQLGRTEEAIQQLTQAVDAGFRDFVWMKVHEDLDPLSGDPGFQTILARGLKR